MLKRKLLEEIREVLRIKNYSYRTEKFYIHWIRKFVFLPQQTASARHGRDGKQVVPKLSRRQSKGGSFYSESSIEHHPLSLQSMKSNYRKLERARKRRQQTYPGVQKPKNEKSTGPQQTRLPGSALLSLRPQDT